MAESKTGRGRPRKNNNIIEINNIKLEFIISKTDNYENEISYLKVIDKAFKNKLHPILSQVCDDCRVPVWCTDDGLYMIKCKNKFMPERAFENNEIFNGDLNFHYFSMSKEDGDLIQGLYLKINTNDVVVETA